MRVLIVDDNDDIRRLLASVMHRAGYEAIEASDGKQAMQRVREAPVDVAIMDMIMPGQDGMETIMELRREYPAVKVIAVSGGGRIGAMDYLDWAQKIGACRAFEKPFDIMELVAAVKALAQQ